VFALWELGSTIDHHYRCGSVGDSYGAGQQPFSQAAGFVGREGYTGLIAFPSYVEPDEIAGDDAQSTLASAFGPSVALPVAQAKTRPSYCPGRTT
jgi:hypothetical protein